MEYSFIKGCKNSCGGYNNTECKGLDIACMCKDELYIQSSICCVTDACGPALVFQAKSYIDRYCEDYKVEPPPMDNLDCAKISSSITSTATATSTLTSGTSSATATAETTGSSITSSSGSGSQALNPGIIAGVAGGLGGFLLALIGAAIYFCCRRKTRAKKEKRKKDEAAIALSKVSKDDLHISASGGGSALEVVHMSELEPTHVSPHAYNQQNSQGWNQYQASQHHTVSPHNTGAEMLNPVLPYSPLGNRGYSAELGTDGGRPHGSELAGRPMLPPRPELQGMSFVTRNPYPSELPPSESAYYR